MTDERLGERIRRLPGVLDCSTHSEAVVVVVDPSVDEQLVKARGQAVLAELGDARPLVVPTGHAAEKLKASSLWASLVPADATPIGLAVFAIAVVCVLALSGGRAKHDPGTAALIPAEDDVTNAANASSLTPELSHWHARPTVSAAPALDLPAPADAAIVPVSGDGLGHAFAHSVQVGRTTRSTRSTSVAAAPTVLTPGVSRGAFGMAVAAEHHADKPGKAKGH